MESAKRVACYILHFFQSCEDPITNLKLQKLLYYVQGWHLALYGSPAFEEDFEAWVHGPVIPSIYQLYKHNRWYPILNEIEGVELSESVKEITDEVIKEYGIETGWALEVRTHNEAPWTSARNGLPADEASNSIITKASMAEYFTSLSNGKNQ